MEKICSIDTAALMKKAVYDQKLTFFQFSKFIEEECETAYLDA